MPQTKILPLKPGVKWTREIGNLEQTYFLNVPKVIHSEECVTQHKLWVADMTDGCSPKSHIVPPRGRAWKIRDLTL